MTEKFTKWFVFILGFVLVFKLAQNIIKNENAGGRVLDEEKKLTEAMELNTKLKKQLAEVKTPLYMEREAREKLGYGKPGEIVLIIPDQKNSKIQIPSSNDTNDTPNWVKWRKLYLGF